QLNQQIELTRQRISRANELIKRISSFTGMDFDGSASGGTSDTSKSATSQPDKLGRGGPLLPIEAGLSYIAVTSSRERNYDEARGLQVIQLDSVIGRLERAADHFDRQQRLLATTPLICPVRGDYTFSDRFGGRYHPVYRRRDFHTGLDVSASRGTAIVAPADGTVTTAHYDSAKGLTLTIDHGIGLFPHGSVLAERAFKTRYFHCSKLFVRKGSKVERGELIALVGSTGVSTGSHLHYEVLVNDQPVDPQFFILDRR
ncbi:M23 family metallopeptidase, partial [Candidatus Sumerlaeota bacterium]|nr:M23 family metallopeptidase [Candidatus Sumerlaeota bacterium]